MKLTKKLLACILTFVLMGTMFTGCAITPTSPDTEPTEAAKTTGGETEAPTKTEEVIDKITIMGIDWGVGPLEDSEMEKAWEDFFDVEFNVEWVSYKDYNTKINTLLAADDIPDVCQLWEQNGSFYFPALTQAIDAGLIADLSPFLFDEGFVEENEIMSTWSENVWNNCVYKNGTYILPGGTTEVALGSVNIRRDLMRKYGYEEEPTTIEELKDFLIGLSKASGLYALEFSTDNFMDEKAMPLAVAFTGMLEWGIDENGEFVYQPFADGYTDFLNYMKDLYDEGAIDPEFILKQDANSSWKSGKSVACLRQWYNWNQSKDRVYNKIFDASLPDTAEAWCLLPVKGPRGYLVTAEPYGFWPARIVNAKASDAKIRKILEVICATGEEYIDMMKNGVEGIHYTWEDGVRVKDDDQEVARREGYVGGWNQIFLYQNADKVNEKFIERTVPSSDESIARAWELKEATENAVAEMNLGLATLNLQSETYKSDFGIMTADVNDMCARYVMGEITIDDWNNYVNGIVTSDTYQKIIAEYKEAANQ